MPRLLRITLIALSAILLLAAACGGDDDSPGTATDAPTETDSGGGDGNDASAELRDYFAEMDQIALRTDTRLEEIGSELDGATFDSDADEITANRDGLQQSGEAIESALLDLSDLDPPAEVEDAHADFFDALNAVLQLFAGMSADIEDVSTSAELEALSADYSQDFANADADFDDACLALQEIADDNGVDADMHCTD